MKKTRFILALLVISAFMLCGCANTGPQPTLRDTTRPPDVTETLVPTIPYATPVEPVLPNSTVPPEGATQTAPATT